MAKKNLKEVLQSVLTMQELDIQMIQLLRLRRERKQELDSIQAIQKNLESQVTLKESEIMELKATIRLTESDLKQIVEKGKKLEEKQSEIKKIEEFNALTHEMAQVNREKTAKENRLSDLYDKLSIEEEACKNLQDNYQTTKENSKVVVHEIRENISHLNQEGRNIKERRDQMATVIDSEILEIYERLLRNKKGRVVVPIENRCCSGCHITVTAQDENLVRKQERLVFCEHCSRIHYWPETQETEGVEETTKTRRRRTRSAA